jgi:hypothetical protein
MFSTTKANLERQWGQRPYQKGPTMRKKCCCEEEVFAFAWNNADEDGMWAGDAASVAEEFGVSENEAHEVLGELCDRALVEKVYPGTYAITKWRERDDAGEEELS